jgi:leader peptidase (prepilin peptidase)/N-methyltransferase
MPVELVLPLLILVSPVIGSFLGVVIARCGKGSIHGRSCCDSCGHQLGVLDLVPVLSWIALKRRCRFCGAKLSLYYPLVELSAIVPVAWAATVQQGLLLMVSAVLGWLLLALAWIDWRTQRLPDRLTLPLAILGLVAAVMYDDNALVDHVLGAVAGYGVFGLVTAVYRRFRGREGLGLGDAKLLGGLGAWLAWESLPSVIFLGAVMALASAMIARLFLRVDERRPSGFQHQIAFGPALAMAGWIVWLYGPLVPTELVGH